MDYEGLKRNVQHLKQEHKKAKELCETSKKVGNQLGRRVHLYNSITCIFPMCSV